MPFFYLYILMIILNSRCCNLKIPLVNRCNLPADEKYYLLIQNTFTKDVFIIKLYDRVHHEFINRKNYQWINFCISLPDHFSYGEYEYYLTPDNLLKVILDINNINHIENEVFKNNKLNFVFSKNGVIFAENGDSIIANTECEADIFRRMRIISSGILKFNEDSSYYERDKQTTSEYFERR